MIFMFIIAYSLINRKELRNILGNRLNSIDVYILKLNLLQLPSVMHMHVAKAFYTLRCNIFMLKISMFQKINFIILQFTMSAYLMY